MMDANLMRLMSLDHLLAAAAAEQDSLTRTPLETELIRRIEELQDEQRQSFVTEDGTDLSEDDLNTLWAACIDNIDTTVALLEVLSKHRISAKDELDDRLSVGEYGIDLAEKLSDETLTELTVFFNQLAERK